MLHIATKPNGKGKLISINNYYYKDIIIEEGFESDGATIPRLLWCVFPPFHPDSLTATFIHDYLCREGLYDKADLYYKELLISSRIPKWKRTVLFLGVISWHKVAYNKENLPYYWLKSYRKITS